MGQPCCIPFPRANFIRVLPSCCCALHLSAIFLLPQHQLRGILGKNYILEVGGPTLPILRRKPLLLFHPSTSCCLSLSLLPHGPPWLG